MKYWLIGFLLCTGCASSPLLKQKDYVQSKSQLRAGQPQLAINSFPSRREAGGFITTVEKGYLSLLNGAPEPERLVKLSEQLDDREVIRVSKEIGHFFYAETEDGYLPAEHEVIWLHLIAGYSFGAKGDRASARVEAARAAELLQGHYAERTGDFDDPGLRLLLAGLWLYCDEWEHARVDLRRAAEMNPDLIWAQEAAEKPHPPSGLLLALAGVGPEPVWKPENVREGMTSIGSLKFPTDDLVHELVVWPDSGKPVTLRIPLSSRDWYERHQSRNSQIREIVTGSKYLSKAAGQSALTGTGFAVSKILAGTIIAVGIGVAVALVGGALYLASQAGGAGSNADEFYGTIAATGVGVGMAALDEGGKFDRESTRNLKKDWNESLDPSPTYRYVRFLPDQIFGALTKNKTYTLTKPSNGAQIAPFLDLVSGSGRSRIQLFHFSQ